MLNIAAPVLFSLKTKHLLCLTFPLKKRRAEEKEGRKEGYLACRAKASWRASACISAAMRMQRSVGMNR